jgi:hypothetical protein
MQPENRLCSSRSASASDKPKRSNHAAAARGSQRATEPFPRQAERHGLQTAQSGRRECAKSPIVSSGLDIHKGSDTTSVYFTVSVAALETSPLGLVTCTASDFAPAATATVTFNCEALTNVTWLPEYDELPTVTFRPVPDWKFVPLIVSTCAAAEPVMGLGVSDVMVGTGGAFTWKLTLLDAPPLEFTTCTA